MEFLCTLRCSNNLSDKSGILFLWELQDLTGLKYFQYLYFHSIGLPNGDINNQQFGFYTFAQQKFKQSFILEVSNW